MNSVGGGRIRFSGVNIYRQVVTNKGFRGL
jgi:hypothetical protein